MPALKLLTVDHGKSDREDLAARLHKAGVQTLVDVRRFPGSRHNPDVRTEASATRLPPTGIKYRWDGRLGGRRRLAPDTTSTDPWWSEESSRAYAAYTRTAPFAQAMTDLAVTARESLTVVMCSESVWWRCHRRLSTVVHAISDGARSSGNDQLTFDRVERPEAMRA